MNANQIVNLITTILQPLLGLLVARGYFDSSQADTLSGAAGIVLVFLVSHLFHADPPSAQKPPTGPMRPALWLGLATMAIGLMALSSGCASANSNTFAAENAAAITADAGMRSYGLHWQSAIAQPAAYHTDTNSLVSQRADIEGASRKLGASIALVEGLRSAYQTNSAVQPQLTAAVTTLTQNTAAMLALVSQFESVTNL